MEQGNIMEPKRVAFAKQIKCLSHTEVALKQLHHVEVNATIVSALRELQYFLTQRRLSSRLSLQLFLNEEFQTILQRFTRTKINIASMDTDPEYRNEKLRTI